MDKPLVSDAISKDFDILDGETNDNISFKCRWRVDDLKVVIRPDWPELLDWIHIKYGKRNPYRCQEIDCILQGTGKTNASNAEISEMIAVVTYLLDGIRSDPDLEQYVSQVTRFKPLMRVSAIVEKGDNTIDKAE